MRAQEFPIYLVIIVILAFFVIGVSFNLLKSKLGDEGEFQLQDSDIPYASGAQVQAIVQACNAWYLSDFIDITMPEQVPQFSQSMGFSAKCVPGDALDNIGSCYEVCLSVLSVYRECAGQYPPTEDCWRPELRGGLGE